MENNRKYRLVTRSDFDGLVCAVLLKEINLIEDILFVHPKDMQDGIIEITSNDITTNLPFVEGVHLAFDHHESETIRITKKHENHIIEKHAPSASRVLYNYYGEASFPNISKDILEAVDKGDSAQFNLEEVLNPTGWNLINFIMDARTGLGRFKEFRISNYQLMMELIEHCKNMSIEQILNLPDVKERVDLYFHYEEKFKDQLKRCSKLIDSVVLLNLRNEDIIYPGNRFVIYALYPQAKVSIHELWGINRQNTVFAVGKSIFDRTSNINIGEVMLHYGGGGHAAAGTCQVSHENAEKVKTELINALKG
ncbi:MAG: exopolyphosphatase [Deferribacteraceae bacterium]|jgi:nanoRNase/pAp phosphatase (c-di-AMP/oligoRNAs hydrolase)|nr:exopolyphosphatase [Deferribacteraceae bacterium]